MWWTLLQSITISCVFIEPEKITGNERNNLGSSGIITCNFVTRRSLYIAHDYVDIHIMSNVATYIAELKFMFHKSTK